MKKICRNRRGLNHRWCRVRHRVANMVRSAALLPQRPLRVLMENSMTSRILLAAAGVGLIMCSDALRAQTRTPEFRIHDRGELWETMKDNGLIGAPNPTNRYEYYPSMDWPGGPHTLVSKDEQRSYGYQAGMWIGGKKTGGSCSSPKTARSPSLTTGLSRQSPRRPTISVPPDSTLTKPRKTITAEWTTTEGIHVKRVSRSWSAPAYNTFLLIEYQVTNLNAAAVTDVFLGFPISSGPATRISLSTTAGVMISTAQMSLPGTIPRSR